MDYFFFDEIFSVFTWPLLLVVVAFLAVVADFVVVVAAGFL